ncbi:MAG: exodeoxyribonuclease VII large subunit, partial [Clostridiales bacterium]|nr:exodeoxyribonuclease VII large subunit [Clostridiales bacterium]
FYQKIEELKQRLKERGVFDEDKKIPVPAFVNNVCVITSKSGAVIHDIIKTVRKKNKSIDITVCDVRVQGTYAAADIAQALKRVDGLGFDIVIVARGGGSLEDLMPFYTEEVAMAVFEMKTPIISAVGHETDFSICDMAADLRMPTPTAAAEYIAYDEEELKSEILSLLNRGAQLISNNYEYKKMQLVSAMKSVSSRANEILSECAYNLKTINARLVSSVSAAFAQKQSQAGRVIAAFDKSSPLRRLDAGYFKIEKRGRIVSKVSDMERGDTVEIYGAGGSVNAVIL